ncbi:hypothetical protein, partial [Leptothrix ochracea]
LRYHAKKASMPDAGHSDAKVSSSSTPLHLSISTLLRCRDDHDRPDPPSAPLLRLGEQAALQR